MNILNSLRVYAGKWQLKESRAFTQEEVDSIASNVVVSSNYGNSLCLFLKTGGQVYIPLAQGSTKGVGETVNLLTAKLLTLGKAGEMDILRVEC